MTKSMTLQLDNFGRQALSQFAEEHRDSASAVVRTASLYYLADRDSGRPAWRVPRFARTRWILTDSRSISTTKPSPPCARRRAVRGSSRRGWRSTRCSTTWRIWTADDSPNGSAGRSRSAKSPAISPVCAVRRPRLLWTGDWPTRFGSRLAPRATSRRGLPLALVDRDEPWGLAAQALAAACAGNGSLVLLEGMEGFGKTTLLTSVRTHGDELGMDVLTAAGQRHERDFGFGVVLQLLEARLARAGEEERASLLSGSARQALPLFEPAPRSVFSEPSFEVLHGVYRLCAKFAARGPLLLAVDDVDHADEASLRFLLHLGARLEELPIALVLTAGSLPARQAHPLVGEVARHPATRRLTLGALDADGTARRVRDAWLPGAPESACRAIHHASAGNPLLIDALAGELVSRDGSAGLTAADVRALAPASVSDWAVAHANGVDPRAAGMLKAVAILGPGAELRHVAGLARA